MHKLTLILVFISLMVGCASSLNSDTSFLQTLQQDAAAYNAIWHQYTPSQRALGFYDSEKVVLHIPPGVNPGGFEQRDDGLWQHEVNAFDLNSGFHINYEFASFTATVIRGIAGETDFATLLHEDFHGFQHHNFNSDLRNDTLSYVDYGDMPIAQLIAALRVERGLLNRAFRQSDAEARRITLFQYASLRTWRETQLPDAFWRKERQIETTEGTANWVGLAAEGILLGDSNHTENRIVELLNQDYERFNTSPTGRLLTARVYATGAALTTLMNRQFDEAWQPEVMEGADLFEALLSRLEWSTQNLVDTGTELTRAPEFERHVSIAEGMRWSRPESEILQEIRTDHPWSITFSIPTRLDSQGRLSNAGGFQTGSPVVPMPGGDLLLTHVDEYQASGLTHQLEIRNKPMLIPAGSRSVQKEPNSILTRQIIIFSQRAPIINSVRHEGPDDLEVDVADIEIPNVTLSGNEPIRIKIRYRD